ncbi:HalOD1 output domain-containing protein [Halorubrum rubrum]|uniref:HalOD1 output domain-containing protein n=1 Tax=Halorubrum rubrum TaxID=1126240 RepID=A0ABD5QZ47_9EURY|nr:HalOD1 output domain-containing protein [Halorubrum rubrum]
MEHTSIHTDCQRAISSDHTTVFEQSEDASVCVAVVEAVSTVTDTDPMRLDPLYDAVDSDALERLIESGAADTETTFAYEGCRITVSGNGGVVVTHPI